MSLSDLQFLSNKSLLEQQHKELHQKTERMVNTLIGRKLKIQASHRFEDISPTSYDFYAEFYHYKNPNALMLPLDQYEECMTTGTMGAPKKFLISKPFLRDCLQTLRAGMLTSCFADGRTTFQPGDTMYINAAPRPFITGVLVDYIKSELEPYIRLVPPDQSQPFPVKTQYFVEHHKEISAALMPLVILFHFIYPKIGQPLNLKGFLPFDTAADAYLKRIKEIVNCRISGSYASTETCVSTIPSAEHELGFIFDPRSIYCEFLQMKPNTLDPTHDIDAKDLISADEVKKGAKYQLFVTPFKNDLTRYNTGDILEVSGTGDSLLGTDLPVLKFFSRAAKVIPIENFTTINESELLLALSRSQIPYVEFTARLELEEGRQYLALYLEPSGQIDKAQAEQSIHQSLSALDPDYATVVRFYEYLPFKLIILPKGSFARLLATKQGVPKIDRINMNEKDFNVLLEISSVDRRSSTAG